MIKCTLFNTRQDIYDLTGIPDDSAHYDKALWNVGFDLDDWDYGVCSEAPLTKTVHDVEDDIDVEEPLNEARLFVRAMENYCVGYDHTEYDGKHYYLVHHA